MWLIIVVLILLVIYLFKDFVQSTYGLLLMCLLIFIGVLGPILPILYILSDTEISFELIILAVITFMLDIIAVIFYIDKKRKTRNTVKIHTTTGHNEQNENSVIPESDFDYTNSSYIFTDHNESYSHNSYDDHDDDTDDDLQYEYIMPLILDEIEKLDD